MLEFDKVFSEIVKENKAKLFDIAEFTGYHINSIGKWKSGYNIPKINVADDLLSIFGYELVVVKKSDRKDMVIDNE